MSENPNKSLEREFERKLKKEQIQLQVDTIKRFTDHEERKQKLIVDYVKRGLKLVENSLLSSVVMLINSQLRSSSIALSSLFLD